MLTHRRLRLIHPVLVSVEFARFLGQFRITANACYIFPRCPYRHPALRESCLTVMRRLRRLAVRACKITKKNLNCQTIRINLFGESAEIRFSRLSFRANKIFRKCSAKQIKLLIDKNFIADHLGRVTFENCS